MTSLLLVEDNGRLRNLMAFTLRQAGYQVFEAENGQKALTVLEQRSIDLLLVDIQMPVMDGFSLIEALRDAGITTPVLIITAKEALEDKRKGFGLGADDYMVKPINMEEMLIRVEALLRRAMINQSRTLTIGDTSLNEDSLTVVNGKKIVVLPQKEFFLLQRLLAYPNKVFTRQALMDEIWGYDNESDPRTVDVHIRRLREKFNDNADFDIETVRGLGYRAVKK